MYTLFYVLVFCYGIFSFNKKLIKDIKYQIKDDEENKELNKFIDVVILNYPEKIIEYKQGNKSLLGFFLGEVIKLSKEQSNPVKSVIFIQQKLNK